VRERVCKREEPGRVQERRGQGGRVRGERRVHERECQGRVQERVGQRVGVAREGRGGQEREGQGGCMRQWVCERRDTGEEAREEGRGEGARREGEEVREGQGE
jgi:hypothetical protein